jgi:hypothetical protein
MADRPVSAFADPGHARCPMCGLRVQRTPDGTLADGMAAHERAVHGVGERAS